MPRFTDFDLDIQNTLSQLPPMNNKRVISTVDINQPCYITNETCDECPYTYDLRCFI